VIHNGDKAASTVGVIIEAKKPVNKAEMLRVSAQDDPPEQILSKLNVKALQELLLYYLRERITHRNIEVKYLIATNIYEWFIFDATLFDRLFAQNKNLVRQFTDFESARLADTRTDFFYKNIAGPFIAGIRQHIGYTYFDIREYEKPLRNVDRKDDNKLIALYKLLSPEHLLKLPFANDSNSLDKRFYGELLHIIGLTETKEKGRKLIERNKDGERNNGSLLESAIIQLDSLDKIPRLDNPGRFGADHRERLFNIGLELCITWINRILFLKLLEAQLISYRKGDKSYQFLNLSKIKDYDDLNSLFFEVLARRHDERNDDMKRAFANVPYLNSSLFEPTDIEHSTLFISQLRDDKTMPYYAQSVLKDEKGRRLTGMIRTLDYLFAFLDAYDFASEGSEEIQEENKTLINASVLGLIFEKINGYKDGSFFTPGFITMYMCRETIRRAVVQKFNEHKGWNCNDLTEIYNRIDDINEANDIVNSLKICDTAVGSGHFLVSALNEIIAIKSDLKILQDRSGKRLKEYHFEVANDELIITDEDGELYEYNPTNKESQRIQEALFHEKQTIIENCLFGVDINPNSVKICRLRLWIELLKNAYYKSPDELETLPNIDINIKCGNSLISRFPLDADLSKSLKSKNYTIDSYRVAVDSYRNAHSKEQKRSMERLITEIKSDFRSEISRNDPMMEKYRKLSGELMMLTTQPKLFEQTEKEKSDWDNKVKKLGIELSKIEAEIEQIKNNRIYENAFEWRFEFPEVLDGEGNFIGFDVVIGNPPYIQLQSIKEISEQLKRFEYETFEKTGDIYSLFYEKGNTILKDQGYLAYITSNKWMRAGYGRSTRNYFLTHTQPQLLIDLGSGVFEEATVDSNILIFKKQEYRKPFAALDVSKEKNVHDLDAFADKMLSISPEKDESWTISNDLEKSIKAKIERTGKPLKEWDINIYRGILTGYNEAFIIDGKKKDELIAQDPRIAEIIKPILRGRDIKRYKSDFADLWLINTHNGIKEKDIPRIDVEKNYPAIFNHLKQYEIQLIKRQDQGDHWSNLRNCAYIEEFEKEKIIYPNMTLFLPFIYDDKSIFTNQKCFILTSNTISLKFLVGFFNSKISHRWIRQNCPELQGGTRELSKIFFENIPVPPLSVEAQKPFIALVDEILIRKENGEDTAGLEAEIDRLVYELYGLTEEEIDIIEN
jgi:adenine-specific DNA-methyltransferase